MKQNLLSHLNIFNSSHGTVQGVTQRSTATSHFQSIQLNIDVFFFHVGLLQNPPRTHLYPGHIKVLTENQ